MMKKNKKTKGPVPYASLSPGFEAIYTGKKSSSEGESDGEGNEISRWPVFTWTFPGQEKDWDEEIKHINEMQSKLGELDDSTRRIRAHIGSLVPCDSGFPVTVDELLNAIGKGNLDEPSFHNGCWNPGMWWEQKTTQPLHIESMRTIHAVLTGYLAGKSKKDFIKKYHHAEGFIDRTYGWLGGVAELTEIQKLLIERMLLPFNFFTKVSFTTPHSAWPEDAWQVMESVGKNCYEKGGRGSEIDARIAALANLPEIYPDYTQEYQDNLKKITKHDKRELYKLCGALAHGLHTLCDCHHSTFRWIESWIHSIGTNKFDIPTRRSGTERERLGHLLFGYVLGLDKWLMGVPMQFLLLDLGHVDLGFDPKNEILRVYAYLGEKRTPVKEWLAACLWHNLTYNPMAGYPAGLIRHKKLLERAGQMGVSPREWMDSALGNDSLNPTD